VRVSAEAVAQTTSFLALTTVPGRCSWRSLCVDGGAGDREGTRVRAARVRVPGLIEGAAPEDVTFTVVLETFRQGEEPFQVPTARAVGDGYADVAVRPVMGENGLAGGSDSRDAVSCVGVG
jgi:hypothetical protein